MAMTTTQTTEQAAALLTDEQIATLNKARTILDALEQECNTRGYSTPSGYLGINQPNAASYGKVCALADVAAEAIFMVLNYGSAHHVIALTDEQMHNRA